MYIFYYRIILIGWFVFCILMDKTRLEEECGVNKGLLKRFSEELSKEISGLGRMPFVICVTGGEEAARKYIIGEMRVAFGEKKAFDGKAISFSEEVGVGDGAYNVDLTNYLRIMRETGRCPDFDS